MVLLYLCYCLVVFHVLNSSQIFPPKNILCPLTLIHPWTWSVKTSKCDGPFNAAPPSPLSYDASIHAGIEIFDVSGINHARVRLHRDLERCVWGGYQGDYFTAPAELFGDMVSKRRLEGGKGVNICRRHNKFSFRGFPRWRRGSGKYRELRLQMGSGMGARRRGHL